jgi:hypothetical protein
MSATDLSHGHPADRTIPGRGAPGSRSLDGDLPASVSSQTGVRRRPWGVGGDDGRAPLGFVGCWDRQPLRRCPPPVAFSATGRGCETTSDALCRACAPRSSRPDRSRPPRQSPNRRHPRDSARRSGARAPDPFPPPARQRRPLPRIRTPSTDEPSPRHARASPHAPGRWGRARGFAAANRLPTLVHPFVTKGLDPRAPGRAVKASAARRLLQP